VVYWALTFLLASGIAWVYGFSAGTIADGGPAQVLFFLLVLLFIATFASHLTRSTN